MKEAKKELWLQGLQQRDCDASAVAFSYFAIETEENPLISFQFNGRKWRIVSQKWLEVVDCQ